MTFAVFDRKVAHGQREKSLDFRSDLLVVRWGLGTEWYPATLGASRTHNTGCVLPNAYV